MFKTIEYDRHARRRMKWRRISEKEVETVLRHPDKIEATEKGRINAFKSVGERLIKVTYLDLNDKYYIISAVDKKD